MQCASSLVYALFGRQFRANFGNFIIGTFAEISLLLLLLFDQQLVVDTCTLKSIFTEFITEK